MLYIYLVRCLCLLCVHIFSASRQGERENNAHAGDNADCGRWRELCPMERTNAVTSVANNARMESCGFGSKGVHHGAGGGKLFEGLVLK